MTGEGRELRGPASGYLNSDLRQESCAETYLEDVFAWTAPAGQGKVHFVSRRQRVGAKSVNPADWNAIHHCEKIADRLHLFDGYLDGAGYDSLRRKQVYAIRDRYEAGHCGSCGDHSDNRVGTQPLSTPLNPHRHQARAYACRQEDVEL